jgi:hypothetical protein
MNRAFAFAAAFALVPSLAIAQQNTATVDQTGVGHQATVSQAGSTNTAAVEQAGRSNTATAAQTGTGNDLVILQDGGAAGGFFIPGIAGNTATASQAGSGNVGEIDQSRRGLHSADLDQAGTGHRATITQGGTEFERGNAASVAQSGSRYPPRDGRAERTRPHGYSGPAGQRQHRHGTAGLGRREQRGDLAGRDG